MQYTKPFTYFVNKRNGFTNLLYCSVCVLIPILGAIILLGYRAEMAEDLDRDPDMQDYEDFDFNRFTEYLSRGVWPFLMQLIVSLVMSAVMILVFGIGFAAAALTKQPLVGFAVGGLLMIPVILATMLLLWPLELHTQLTARFEFGRACGFASRLLGRVWGQAAVAAVVYWLLSSVTVLIGYAALCIGVYPAVVIIGMAQQHFAVQLYRLYLDEGGEPIRGPSEQLEIDEE